MATKKDLWDAVWAAEREDKTIRIQIPSDAVPILGHWRINARTEGFYVIALNGAHEVIRVRTITKGLVNRTMVHPREVFRGAIMDDAAAVVVAHNHPSGNLVPSTEDDKVTRQLIDAGQVVGIAVLDHVIVSKCGYFSYLEADRL